VQDPGGTTVVSVSVAAGATVDLAMADRWPAVVLVRRGTALIGDQLTPVVGPALAALTDVGQRLGVATHLSDDAGADLVVVTTRPLDHAVVHREGLVAAGTAEELDAVLDEARATGFGALPRLDG
jgi:redox-sensitive bicupin YhaK (pirin superfamily)